MDVIKLITNNWAQIVVLLGAIGYICKVVLDFRVKKFEIKFEVLFKSKMSEIQSFVLAYDSFYSLYVDNVFVLYYSNITKEAFDEIIKPSLKNLLESCNRCRIYYEEKQAEPFFIIYNNSSQIERDIKNIIKKGLVDIGDEARIIHKKLDQYRLDNKKQLDIILKEFVT